MDTHAEILERLDVPRVARALGVTYNAAAKWRAKNWIPAEYWIELSDWSASINRPVTLERLALAAKKARR